MTPYTRRCSWHSRNAAAVSWLAGTASWPFAAVEEFLQLHNSLKSWAGVSNNLKKALTPDASVEHAMKMLGPDDRMRVFMSADSHWGAMYFCNQAQIDWASFSSINSSAGKVLLFPFESPALVYRCCALLLLPALSCWAVARAFVCLCSDSTSQCYVALLSIAMLHQYMISDVHLPLCNMKNRPCCVVPFE